MSAVAMDENQLAADVERLKNEVANTQELYRDVCVLMFFRYGITPTANKLYQLVRRGSMSAPADALRKFWETLRDKSRIRIDHPDLPDTLKEAAAEFAASLWTQAQSAAQEHLATWRDDAARKVAEAEADAATKIEESRAHARLAVESAQRELAAAVAARHAERDRADTLSARLSDAEVARASLAEQLSAEQASHARVREQRAHLEQQLVAHQADKDRMLAGFTEQLDKFRIATAASEARHEAMERRALLDLDQERTRNGRLARQVEQAQTRLGEVMTQQARATADLQQEINGLRERAGELEGRVAAGRERATAMESLAAQAHEEKSQLQERLRASEQALAVLRAAPKSPRASPAAKPPSPPAA